MPYDHNILMKYRPFKLPNTSDVDLSDPFEYYVPKDVNDYCRLNNDNTFSTNHNKYVIQNNEVKRMRSFSDDFKRVIYHKSREVFIKYKYSIIHMSSASDIKCECEYEMREFMKSWGYREKEYLIECFVKYDRILHSLILDVSSHKIEHGIIVTDLTDLDFDSYEYVGLSDLNIPFVISKDTNLERIQGAKVFRFLNIKKEDLDV